MTDSELLAFTEALDSCNFDDAGRNGLIHAAIEGLQARRRAVVAGSTPANHAQLSGLVDALDAAVAFLQTKQ